MAGWISYKQFYFNCCQQTHHYLVETFRQLPGICHYELWCSQHMVNFIAAESAGGSHDLQLHSLHHACHVLRANHVYLHLSYDVWAPTVNALHQTCHCLTGLVTRQGCHGPFLHFLLPGRPCAYQLDGFVSHTFPIHAFCSHVGIHSPLMHITTMMISLTDPR